ncbi:MAG: hypothetical protein FJ267_20155 [Planctomycetes bacterium]|nr:hypothetical protein [Planctomycetota bacterium]
MSAETSSRHSSHDFLKGYCPVALRDLEELIPALDLFSMVHEGVEYHFSTSVALAKFRKNPDRYAPMARGADLVVAHVTGETVSGSLDFSVWHRDHLYLFSNARNLESFREAPFLFTSE